MTWIPVRGLLAGKEILAEYGQEAVDRLATVCGREHEDHIRAVLASGLPVADCLRLPGEPDIVLPSRLSVSVVVDAWEKHVLPQWPVAVWGPPGAAPDVRSNRLNYRVGTAIDGVTLTRPGIAEWRSRETDGVCPSMAIYRR